jgi:hypothetical protein
VSHWRKGSLLPPQALKNAEKLTLVLDMDETLLHR